MLAAQHTPSDAVSSCRKNHKFSDAERDALIEGVTVRGTGNWADILHHYRGVFHHSRKSNDLKDKWRNLVMLAQNKRAPRGSTLPREQIIKILEVLHTADGS
jgi:hypothetical protein